MSLTNRSPSTIRARAPPPVTASAKPAADPSSCTNVDARTPQGSGGRPVEPTRGAGQPRPGWKACEGIRPPQPNSAWTPDDRNLAGSDWTTRNGPAPAVTTDVTAAQAHTNGVAGRVLTITDAPLPGVQVSIDGATTTTDSWGRFLLTGVPAGHRVLRVDGGTTSDANSNSDSGQRYGLFDIGVDLADGVVTTLPYTVFLPQLDTAHEVTVANPPSGDDTTMTHQRRASMAYRQSRRSSCCRAENTAV